jgi:hypothetical protein
VLRRHDNLWRAYHTPRGADAPLAALVDFLTEDDVVAAVDRAIQADVVPANAAVVGVDWHQPILQFPGR